jgi:hypothetical protein
MNKLENSFRHLSLHNKLKPLPTAILGHIGSFVPDQYCILFTRCSRAHHAKMVRQSTFRNRSSIVTELFNGKHVKGDIDKLKQFFPETITSLTIRAGAELDRQKLQKIVRVCTKLQMIRLDNCIAFDDACMKELVQMQSLRSVSLFSCLSLTEAGGSLLAGLSHLHRFQSSLCMSLVTDSFVQAIGARKTLTSLKIEGPSVVTDQGIGALPDPAKWRELQLHLCTKLTDQALLAIGKMSNLRSLDLSEVTHITDAGLLHLKQLSKLSSLSLQGCDQLSAAGVRTLFEHLPNVEKVAISGKLFGTIPCVHPLKNIRELYLKHCSILTKQHAIALGKLTTLCALSIHEFTALTDHDLLYFSSLTQLEYLSFIKTCDITKNGVKKLTNLLRNLPKLNFFSLPKAAISEQSLKKLRRDFPKIDIKTNA